MKKYIFGLLIVMVSGVKGAMSPAQQALGVYATAGNSYWVNMLTDEQKKQYINSPVADGKTLLMVAITDGGSQLPIIENLLAWGADVNIPLKRDIEAQKRRLNQEWSDRRIDIDTLEENLKKIQNQQGWTALSFAFDVWNVPLIKRLLAVPGVNVNVLTSKYNMPLIFDALRRKDVEIMTLLLNTPGVNVNEVYKGATALDFAQHQRNLNQPMIDLLKAKGAVQGQPVSQQSWQSDL